MRSIRCAPASIALAAILFAGPACLADKSAKKSKDKKVDDVVIITPISPKVEVKQQPDVSSAPQRPNGSLWNTGSNLVEDVKARRVGDLLTIIVQENTTASSAATTKSDKSDSANFAGGTGMLRRFLKDFGASAQASHSGTGATTRSGSLAAKLTVVVKEVLPNGNLAVEGEQMITINKETQKVVIAGIVRPQDIQQDNSVLSPLVANATIQYDGKGTVGDRQRKGIIGRIFDLIF